MPTPEARERRAKEMSEQRDRIDYLFTVFHRVAIALVVGAVVFVGVSVGAFVRMAHIVSDQKSARYRTLVTGCRDQNRRHDHTIGTLDQRLEAYHGKVSPARAKRLAESRAFTVALIDALVPDRPNCVDYARRNLRP